MSKQGKRDFRPNIHFTPEKNWNNDPNGLIYIDGIWHLYYQNNPNDVVWGPMHWGHAISKDLIHWEHLPVALYPDEIGTMYSGSMAYDENNTSGFAKYGEKPMVAVYTAHNMETGLEQQCIAYSLDQGKHFEKYYGNPVIKTRAHRISVIHASSGMTKRTAGALFWHLATMQSFTHPRI